MIKDLIDIYRYKHPDVWGVLCIDCWNVDSSNDNFYHNALEKLKKFPIGAVINCATDVRIDYQDKSIYNTLTKYLWNNDTGDTRTTDHILLDLIKSAGEQKTNEVLNQLLFNSDTVHITSKTGFIEHTQRFFPNIKNWIILGSAWRFCTHIGPLGLSTLVDIPEHKFHIFPEWSIQTENAHPVTVQDVEDDYFLWSAIADDGYRLICNVGDRHKWQNKTI